MSRKQTVTTVVSQTEVQEEVNMNLVAQPVLTLQERMAQRIAEAKAAALAAKTQKEQAEMDKIDAPKAEKVAKEMPLCGCGCGVRTGGGKYRPGHDAKHKSDLFKAAKAGDEDAFIQIEKLGWLHLMGTPKAPTEPKISRKVQLAAQDEEAVENAMRLAECDAMVSIA